MLVLSRKKDQNLLFPNLGITVEILRVDGKTVRIGVDAPKDIRVLRGELVDRDAIKQETPSKPQPETEAERKARHEMRNRLHTASLALHLLQKQ